MRAEALTPDRLNSVVFGVFAAVALSIAVVGVAGVLAFSVSARTREFGIRMALGAQKTAVFRLVVRQGLQLAFTGVVIGLIAAFGLTRLMKSLLYGVSATDAPTFALIALLLSVVALAACWIPARRATKVDPMVALRCE